MFSDGHVQKFRFGFFLLTPFLMGRVSFPRDGYHFLWLQLYSVNQGPEKLVGWRGSEKKAKKNQEKNNARLAVTWMSTSVS